MKPHDRVVRLASGETPGQRRAREDSDRELRRLREEFGRELHRFIHTATPDEIVAAIADRAAADPAFDAEALGDRIARMGWEHTRRRAPLPSRPKGAGR